MNKPMVFLSHSKKDISFIHRLETDLRRSGIDTWLDEIDIRHGESWLNEIFEHGIAKCDFVLVYITENSLASAMVAKEIDSTLVNQLREGRVKLLIYVDSDSTREKLRYDLQSLHCPTLDDNSYAQVFPVVISNREVLELDPQRSPEGAGSRRHHKAEARQNATRQIRVKDA